MWTAKDDARYISPLFALPGYRHTIGVARSWHFINVYGFIITGLVFVSIAFRYRPMAKTCTDLMDRRDAGLAHVRCLRQFPVAPGT